MTVHAPSDVKAITVPGGCGNPHTKDPNNRDRFSIDCAACEPLIIELRHGWGYEPHQVALTPDEIGIAEAQEKQAARQQNRVWGDPNALGNALATALGQVPQPASGPPPLSFIDQLKALSAEERAAVRDFLSDPDPGAKEPGETPPPAETAEAPTSSPKQAETLEVEKPTPPAKAPAKRTPAKKATAAPPVVTG